MSKRDQADRRLPRREAASVQMQRSGYGRKSYG